MFKTIIFLLLSVPLMAYGKPGVKTAKWIVAHNSENGPILDLIRKHAKIIEQKTQGAVRIEIAPASKSGDDTHREAYQKVESGEVEFSQVSIRGLGSVAPEILALDLPFLFSSYSHAIKFLDGSTGVQFKDSLMAKSKGRVRGMDFTFSGGYRKFFLTKPVTTLSELTQLTVRITDPTPPGANNEVNDTTLYFFNQLGLKSCSPSANPGQCRTKKLVIERELNRFYVLRQLKPRIRNEMNFVLDTNHNLFLTLMVANEAYLQSLKPDVRKILMAQLHELAIEERKLSVSLEQSNKQKLLKDGVQFVKLDGPDQILFEAAGRRTLEHFRPQYGEMMKVVEATKVMPNEKLFGAVSDHTLQ